MREVRDSSPNPSLNQSFETLLRQRFDEVCLEKGEQDRDWLQETKLPGRMILDPSMPGIGALEVDRWARADRFPAHVPVIVPSSKDSTADGICCSTLGAHAYVVKPFHPADLEARIVSLFRGRC